LSRYLLTHNKKKYFLVALDMVLSRLSITDKFTCSMKKQCTVFLSKSLLFASCFFIPACQATLPNDSVAEQKIDNKARLNTQLVLNDAVLEQSNLKGDLIWKIRAKKTTYSDDRKTAYVKDITANLLQNEQVIIKVKGDKGEIRENGNVILLTENVIANDVRNKSVFRGNHIEWHPLENTLVIKDNLQVNHPDLIVTANTAKYFTDVESLELLDEVVANTINPNLLLEGERLSWQIPQQKIISQSLIKVVRYQKEEVTDRLFADTAQIDLKAHNVNLHGNVELNSLEPELSIAANAFLWNYRKRIINSDQPIQLVNNLQQFSVTGNQGQVDFKSKIATLQNGVQGINSREQATLYAQQAIWNIAKKEIDALGNVIYNRTQPNVNLTGDKALINLDANKATITSNQPIKKPVVSVVINESSP